MLYLSTQGGHESDISSALMQGLSPDGGLYVPEELPSINASQLSSETIPSFAVDLLSPFFENSSLSPVLGEICRDALNFPIPLHSLETKNGNLAVLEVFHGPTAAFKDVGARFLAACMEKILPEFSISDARPVTILVATSGDTGGAVASAFHRRAGVRVGVLFPKDQVSPRQKHQLTCWDGNIRSFEVDGSFDDCQTLVKAAFTNPELNRVHRFSAANSINIGRLLPQAVYPGIASLQYWRAHGSRPNFIVPTGNLGNAMACIWAKGMGMPIGDIVLATNSNRTIADFLATGHYETRPSIPTLASAMDVGAPSNMERLRHLFPDLGSLRTAVECYPVHDQAIRSQIAKDYDRFGRLWCPHTATGFWAYDNLPESRRLDKAWIVVATAHPAKFNNIVQGIVNLKEIEVPSSLASLFGLPAQFEPLRAELGAFSEALARWDE